jgi:hypothetical protein
MTRDEALKVQERQERQQAHAAALRRRGKRPLERGDLCWVGRAQLEAFLDSYDGLWWWCGPDGERWVGRSAYEDEFEKWPTISETKMLSDCWHHLRIDFEERARLRMARDLLEMVRMERTYIAKDVEDQPWREMQKVLERWMEEEEEMRKVLGIDLGVAAE